MRLTIIFYGQRIQRVFDYYRNHLFMYRAVFHGLSHGLAGAGFFFVRNPGPQHLWAGCAAGDEQAAAGKGNYTGNSADYGFVLP